MADIRNLIKQIAAELAQLCETQFVAPSVRGGKVRTRVAGLIYTFTPKSKKFEGWGIFQPINEKTARLVAEADLPEITEYLAQFPLVRLWLVDRIQGKSWLAYPVNESDLRQRMGLAGKVRKSPSSPPLRTVRDTLRITRLKPYFQPDNLDLYVLVYDTLCVSG